MGTGFMAIDPIKEGWHSNGTPNITAKAKCGEDGPGGGTFPTTTAPDQAPSIVRVTGNAVVVVGALIPHTQLTGVGYP